MFYSKPKIGINNITILTYLGISLFLAEKHIVDHAIFLRFESGHPVVAVIVFINLLEFLARMVGYDGVELILERLYFAGGDLAVRCLTLSAAHGLMNHHAGVLERETLALLSGYKKHSGH